jgi:hypothetical protein
MNQSGMAASDVPHKNRHETSVCPHNIPLLAFSRPPLFEKIAAYRSGSPKARS